MTSLSRDRDELLVHLRSVVGKRVWRPRAGPGSFLLIDLGEPVEAADGVVRGEFHLFVHFGLWQVRRAGAVIGGHDSHREALLYASARLHGLRVTNVTYDERHLRADFEFEDGYAMDIHPCHEPDAEDWMLFLPDRTVVVAGPDGDFYREELDAG